MIGALDAKKAFDSVDHNFIKKTLTKVGLEGLINMFELLYNSQRVDIDVNGQLNKGYKIRNGVKQSDSLSCILFILTMEPLMHSNIDSNNNIETIKSDRMGIF